MMSYGIFRVEKLKTIANLRGSLRHAFREQYTPNADASRLAENVILTPDTTNVASSLEKYERLKPTGKIRADVTHAFEVLVTASRDEMAKMTKSQREEYLKKSLAFCNAEFGEKNLIHAQIHNDETTAHLTAFYIPVVEKTNKKGQATRKLNASDLLGGKKEFSERQTRFYERVSKEYGLKRGELNSKAEHKRISDWYKELNAEKKITLPAIMEEVENKAKDQVTIEIDEPKEVVFGISYGTEKVAKNFPLPKPVISVEDVKKTLTPYENSNSEMKRREREALKKQAREQLRAEVEEEMRNKLKHEKTEVERLKKEVLESERNLKREKELHKKHCENILKELGAEKLTDDVEKEALTIIKKANEANNELRSLRAFKNEVDGVVNSWEYTETKQKCYKNFNEYRDDFNKNHNDNIRLKKELNEIKQELNKVQQERNELREFKDEMLDLVKGFIENTSNLTLRAISSAVRGVVNLVNKFNDFDFIKEKYQASLIENYGYIEERIADQVTKYNHSSVGVRHDALLETHRLLEVAKNADIAFGYALELKYGDKISECHKYVSENKHQLNMPGMGMSR